MRKPTVPERLYLDFDGFFASVEQLLTPNLRGRPIGVVPHEGRATSVIAVSREAKVAGVKTFMSAMEARSVCRDIVFVPQRPDMYRRAHNALLAEINAVIEIDAVKSIDELSCRLQSTDAENPGAIALEIKGRLRREFGTTITSSVGIAANRPLAKLACKAGKWRGEAVYGDGLTIWHPSEMPTPLLAIKLEDIAGIGSRMKDRLARAGIFDTAALLATSPKQLRALWGNLHGERLWFALHGYEIESGQTNRGMFGHSRVLAPDSRDCTSAFAVVRVLAVKSARRMRREGYCASQLYLSVDIENASQGASEWLPAVFDDHSILGAARAAWDRLNIPRHAKIFRASVSLGNLCLLQSQQSDMFDGATRSRRKWEAITTAIDKINAANGETVVSIGPWAPPNDGQTGGKIAYARVPDFEDFM